jgi:hypothetical protein
MKLVRWVWLLLLVGAWSGCVSRPEQSSVSLEQTVDSLRWISSMGQEVLGYQLKQPMGTALNVESACYFHPFNTPLGVTVTDVAPSDHRHHRGIFFAWLEMHGASDADFWGWGQYAPTKGRRIINRAIEEHDGDTVRIRNAWLVEGTPMIDEQLDVHLQTSPAGNILDLTYTLMPKGDIKLPQWAFGGFAVRAPKGAITVSSSGGKPDLPAPNHMKPETDWPDRAWYAYSFDLAEGKKAGVAVFNHPGNPPSLWHNAASIALLNPCSVAPGPMELKAGRPAVFMYRVVAFDGPVDEAWLSGLSTKFAHGR